NFRFGHRHAGGFRALEELGRRFGCETEIVDAVSCRGRIVSSSAIRELLGAGRVSLAARFLERPYALEGEVTGGRGVGSKQTVPTLNLATDAGGIPARGVYVTRTHDLEDGREWNSITNIGYRPTFGESGERTIETFLLDPLEGEAPRRIRVAFLHRLRDKRRFSETRGLRETTSSGVETYERLALSLQRAHHRPDRPAAGGRQRAGDRHGGTLAAQAATARRHRWRRAVAA